MLETPDPARRVALLAEVGLVFLLSELVKFIPMQLGIAVQSGGPQSGIDAQAFLHSHLITVPLTVLLLVVMLRAEGSGLRDLGFRWPSSVRRSGPASWRQVGVHTGVAFLLLYGTALVFGTALQALGMETHTKDLFRPEDPRDLVSFYAVAILQGGFLEELLYRGYLLIRLTEALSVPGRRRLSLWLAATLLAAGFGGLHLYQAPAAGVMATALALTLTWIVLWQRRNLLVAMMAHALYDIAQFTILYFWTASELEAPGN